MILLMEFAVYYWNEMDLIEIYKLYTFILIFIYNMYTVFPVKQNKFEDLGRPWNLSIYIVINLLSILKLIII